MFIPLIIIKYCKHFNILCPKIAKFFIRQKKFVYLEKFFNIIRNVQKKIVDNKY